VEGSKDIQNKMNKKRKAEAILVLAGNNLQLVNCLL
jgi:hypothetical protein